MIPQAVVHKVLRWEPYMRLVEHQDYLPFNYNHNQSRTASLNYSVVLKTKQTNKQDSKRSILDRQTSRRSQLAPVSQ